MMCFGFKLLFLFCFCLYCFILTHLDLCVLSQCWAVTCLIM